MLKVRYSLVFDRKNKIPAKGEGLVQIQAYLNGGRRYFTTKMYIVEKEWDAKRNDFKNPYVAKSVRALINELETFEVNFRALHRSFAL